GAPSRTAISSRTTGHGTKPPPCRTPRPSGLISSRNRSVLSTRPAVSPHAAKPLWPAGKAGAPAEEAPAAAHSGVGAVAGAQGRGVGGGGEEGAAGGGAGAGDGPVVRPAAGPHQGRERRQVGRQPVDRLAGRGAVRGRGGHVRRVDGVEVGERLGTVLQED